MFLCVNIYVFKEICTSQSISNKNHLLQEFLGVVVVVVVFKGFCFCFAFWCLYVEVVFWFCFGFCFVLVFFLIKN